MSDNKPSPLSGEKVSYNSRAVLLGLLLLVAFILAVYTISVNTYPPEKSGRLNTVFIAAISGSLALGGTLISQLWGKSALKPSINAIHPDDTSADVSPNTSVSASFNMLMDKSTINSKTFTLKDSNNKDVSGTISYEGGNAILKPTNGLDNNTKYTAKISKNAKSMTGNSLEADKEWSFTTA
jgi:Bacterial Ig-like domain